MSVNRISDLFNIKQRFIRSANLELDFGNQDALKGYVLTPPAQLGLERIADGLLPKSRQRAWRITGDYGTGKSSFALALAHLFSDGKSFVPPEIRRTLDFRKLGHKRPQLLPVLLTGTRAPLNHALAFALRKALDLPRRGKPPRIIEKLRGLEQAIGKRKPVDSIALLLEAASFVRESGRASGLLLIVDELGKFLEFAASHPDQQDVFVLQSLAEIASRSGDTPIFVVGILHQGFHAYAEQLNAIAQKEWSKVADRYEEILFDQPLEQVALLIGNALTVRRADLPRGAEATLKREMAQAVALGWFGAGASRDRLLDVAPLLYPLHPTVVPALARLFNRFGQNERSLFSFLLSSEPHSLQQFALAPAKAQSLYRLHNLYDYARGSFGHRLTLQSFRSHWNQIESVVEGYPKSRQHELEILKTVAILNLLDSSAMLATDDSLALAAGNAMKDGGQVKQLISDLHRRKSILYYRGSAGGYCLWPNTSVNLERAYQDAQDAVPVPQQVGPVIREHLESRPLVARRHYIETGNLRHFEVNFTEPSDLRRTTTLPTSADGRVVVVLCETERDSTAAIEFASSEEAGRRRDTLIAVPQPLSNLAKHVANIQRWEWIQAHTPELAHDIYAHEEVTRQLTSCRHMLSKELQRYVGLRQFAETLELQWFHAGKSVKIGNGRLLLEKLSYICDVIYPSAPRIRNELVNRHTPSSAAAAARLRLIERILAFPSEPQLGMSQEGKPPEMSMYLSVLKAANLHQETRRGWSIALPPEDDDRCGVRPILKFIQENVERRQGKRIQVTELLSVLRQPPFGLRDGLGPLLLAVFAVIHEQDVAFYEEGAFLRQVTGQEFHRLIKAPERFELQYCKVAGVRTAVFQRLFQMLNPEAKIATKIDLLEVVKPLCIFAAKLPVYATRTSSLSRPSLAVREALLRAEEPAKLIFETLPLACGCEPFLSDQSASTKRVTQFVNQLRRSIDELRAAYPELLERIKQQYMTAIERPGAFDSIRSSVATTSQQILTSVTEHKLKAFCLRLADTNLGEQPWLESLGSLICAKPPDKWLDSDVESFEQELERAVRQFRRVESALFDGDNRTPAAQSMRVSITYQDGREVDQILHLDESEKERVSALESSIRTLIANERRLGTIAATRVISSLDPAPSKP